MGGSGASERQTIYDRVRELEVGVARVSPEMAKNKSGWLVETLQNWEEVYPDRRSPRRALMAARTLLRKPTPANQRAAWQAFEETSKDSDFAYNDVNNDRNMERGLYRMAGLCGGVVLEALRGVGARMTW